MGVSVFQVCSPKELVVGLLEQVEEAEPDAVAETVTLLLIPLQTGEERSHCSWCSSHFWCTVYFSVSHFFLILHLSFFLSLFLPSLLHAFNLNVLSSVRLT